MASVTDMFLAYRWSRTALADDSERHGNVLGLPLEQGPLKRTIASVTAMFLANRAALVDDRGRHSYVLLG